MPSPDPMRSGAARSYPGWIPRLARLALAIFFRRTEVVGVARVPSGVPLLYVANHNNGLVDPVLVVGHLPGRARFLAKSTLWKNPFVSPFLRLGRVIPVYRRQDPGFDATANEEAFDACREVLAGGGAVALFPEGKSHSEPALAEIRTGAARILDGLPEAVRARVAIVPVGLHFDAKDRFRSRALVVIGEPFDPAPVLAGREGVRALTMRIADALGEVTVSYPSWEEARLLERAVEIFLREEEELPAPTPLVERLAVSRGFVAARARLAASAPERIAPLRRAVRAYDRMLTVTGLTDAQVAASYPTAGVARFVAETALRLLVGLPLGLLGIFFNYLPYRACGLLGARVAHNPEEPASQKLFGGLILFPFFWALWVAAAAWVRSPAAGAVVAVLAPVSGYVALRFRDRLALAFTESRAYLRLRLAGRRAGELRARRRAVREELRRLAAELEGEGERSA